jgi:hypothetical protein
MMDKMAEDDKQASMNLKLTGLTELSYEHHRRLLNLYVGSDSKVLLPHQAYAGTELQQWSKQNRKCGVCLKQMELFAPLQWDIYKGWWVWMHALCNTKNPWSKLQTLQMPFVVLDPVAEFQQLYKLRHENQKLFDNLLHQVLQPARPNPSGRVHIEAWEELLKEMRVRLTNLVEQALTQIRFMKDMKLLSDFHSTFEDIKLADPDIMEQAKHAFLNDSTTTHSESTTSTSKKWRSRKKRRTTKNEPH